MAECIPRGGKKYRIRQFCRRNAQGKKVYCFDKTLTFEAIKKRNSFIRDIEMRHEKGTLHDKGRVDELTLNSHLDRWLAHKKPHLELNTYADYAENLGRYVRPALGDRFLASIKPIDVQEVYDDMIERGLSARAIRNLHNPLNQAFEKAVWWELIPTNPATRTERPKVKRGKIEVLHPDEAPRFLTAAKKDRLACYSLSCWLTAHVLKRPSV